MSFEIQEKKVKRVMLGNDWYSVSEQSFTLDAYEFCDGETPTHQGGQSGICATGFRFIGPDPLEGDVSCFYGPLSSIKVVEIDESIKK